LPILNRGRKWAPNLRAADRFIAGLCAPFIRLARKRRLADQRTPPNAKKQFFELREIFRAKLGLPFSLDLVEHLQSLRPRGASALGKADNTRAAFIRRVGPDQVAKIFQTPK
jgi:hypothetical protein